MKINRLAIAALILLAIFLFGCADAQQTRVITHVSEPEEESEPETISEYARTRQLDNEYYDSAIATNNVKWCDKILYDNFQRDDCYSQVSIATNDLEVCSSIGYTSHLKNKCFYEIAVALENASICERIQAKFKKQDCYERLAIILKDYKLCRDVEDRKMYCYNEVAMELKDISICDKLYTQEDIDECKRLYNTVYS